MPVVLEPTTMEDLPCLFNGMYFKVAALEWDVCLASVAQCISDCWMSVRRALERDADQQLSILKEAGLSDRSWYDTGKLSSCQKKTDPSSSRTDLS